MILAPHLGLAWEGFVVAELKTYEVTVHGIVHTVQLSDADAERYGDAAREVGVKVAPKPENKGRSAANKKG